MNQYRFTDDYNIIKPSLKSNITGRPVKNNPLFGDVESFFYKDILSEFKLKSTSFDFFILWNKDKSQGVLNKSIWFKRVIKFNNSRNTVVNINNNFIEKLIECESKTYIEDNLLFLSKYDLIGFHIIIKDSLITKGLISNNTPIVVSIPLTKSLLNKDLNFLDLKGDLTIMDLDNIEKSLIDNSGGRFSINKPLNYSTTALEHILAENSKETGALWPGDCDLIIYDENYECKMILEFKKCTEYGNIQIGDQSFDNYKTDITKYKRLAILRDYMSNLSNSSIPLITIFYPTTDEKLIKIQLIGGSPSNLFEVNNKLLEIPNNKDQINQFKTDFINELLLLCKRV